MLGAGSSGLQEQRDSESEEEPEKSLLEVCSNGISMFDFQFVIYETMLVASGG